MKFSRIEVRRVVRHSEEVDDIAACRELFKVILDRGLKFTCSVRGYGHPFLDCHVVTVSDDTVRLISRNPSKVNLETNYNKIDSLEVVSALELKEEDDGGRWSMIG